jgi:acyl-CoA synthetase (AMP-forming)/AMP-acid ligase II
MDLGSVIRRSAHAYASRIAVSCDGRDQTYTELFDRSCRLADALAHLGLRPGDRVALLGPNGPETVEQVAAVALGGYVRTALYAHQTADANAYLLDLVGARALIAHASLVEDLRDSTEHVIAYGGETPEGVLDYETLVAGAEPTDPRVARGPDDLHVIRFSAGTTGRPKGIVHTNAAWLRGGDEFRWVTPQLNERDAYLAAGPLTHAAVVFLWPVLQTGGRVVVMPAFDPGEALRLIEAERATVTLMVPTMIQALVAHPDAATRSLDSLRCLSYAASPISERTMLRAMDVFGEDVLHQWYGQSEAWPLSTLLPHQHRDRPSSVGRPTPNTELTIVDDDGASLPTGEIGEIAVRTPGQMLGHWDDPEGTAARTLDDGRLLTRDMGYLDDEGFVFLADRKEDMIISGGYNVWPAELEDALTSHPAVVDACVVGVPHERWGETPKGVVVLAEGAEVSEQELIELTRAKAGSVKKITSLEVVGELPRSAVGKLLRREVRERFWAGRDERVSGA